MSDKKGKIRKRGDESLDSVSFSNRVIQLFHNEGITQAQAAERMGIDAQYLSKCLNGSRPITVNLLMGLSKEFGCSVDYLLGNNQTNNEKSQAEESPSLQKIMYLIDNLFTHGHISFDHVNRTEVIGYDIDGYPEYDDITVPVIIADSKSLRQSVNEYIQLINSVFEDKVFKRKMILQWLESQYPIDLDDLKEIDNIAWN